MPNELIYQSEFKGEEMDARFAAVAQLTDALEALTTVVAQKYVKPASGIPSTDMDADVQAALAKANTAVQSLADYYTKSEVDQLLAAINGMDYVDVAALPTASASTLGKIYLVGPDGSGYYSYYYTSYDGSTYSWVGPLGTTQISLANYATKAELSQLDQELNGIIVSYGSSILTGGAYIDSSDGTEKNNTYRSRTDFVEIEPGAKLVFTVYGSSNPANQGYALYDENKQYVSGVADASATVKTVTIESVPANVKYIRISFVGTSNQSFSSFSFVETLPGAIDVLSDKILDIQEDITDIDTELEDHEERIAALENAAPSSEGLDYILEVTPAIQKVQSDFTTAGLWKDASAEIDASYESYRALPSIDVVEGQIIKFHNWQKGAENTVGYAAAIWCYDDDGLPFDGVSAKRQYRQLTTKDYTNGDYTFTIPSNCSKVGLAFNFTAYPVGDDAYIEIGEPKYEFTDEAKEMINEAVEQGNEVGVDSAKYYLKGNSNIVYSSAKKLGIIAAGQSNIDGRNSYSDLPSGFVNPNDKVRFCNNTDGTFADFQVTDGGAGNDWSFDAIVYDLLTKTAYGNQSEIFVMKKSMGGTSIDPLGETDYHWTADYEFLESASASLLRTFESIIRKGVELQGANFDIKAMLWHQGEGDMQNESVANRYYENLKNMLAYVRGIVGNPRLHVFCGNISLNRTTPGYVTIINAAYTKLASEDPYLHVVDMSNAQLEDGFHFNYEWSIYFGQKVYDLMIDAGIISGTKINPSEPS